MNQHKDWDSVLENRKLCLFRSQAAVIVSNHNNTKQLEEVQLG